MGPLSAGLADSILGRQALSAGKVPTDNEQHTSQASASAATMSSSARKLSWIDLTEEDYDVKWLYGEETDYIALLMLGSGKKEHIDSTSIVGPRPAPAAACSLCEHPPNNAIAVCGCGLSTVSSMGERAFAISLAVDCAWPTTRVL